LQRRVRLLVSEPEVEPEEEEEGEDSPMVVDEEHQVSGAVTDLVLIDF
jgi:hypothetical protein